jgi:hypothetical protein
MTQDEINLQKIKDRICESPNIDGGDRIRALFGLDRHFAISQRCRRADVDSFFTWSAQPEGHSFWSDINDEIGCDDGCGRVTLEEFEEEEDSFDEGEDE